MANRLYSPLRYPGGKARLAPFVKSLFSENSLVGRHYIEPFAGGAGVALSLLFDEYASTVTINDFDRSIYAFWHSVRNKNDRFCQEIKNTPINMKTWEKQKKIQSNKKRASLFRLGFSTFYLNRTNVSGIIKGGVIGGQDQLGEYKIDARFNKDRLIKRIEKIGMYRDRIEVKNEDALNLLKTGDTKDTFVYLDPPYVKKAHGLYVNFYNEDDHNNIAQLLLSKKSDFYWLLSYDQNELIDRLYRKCNANLTWNVGYGSSNRRSKESLFTSKRLHIKESKKVISS